MADADGAAVAARELQEERERSQKMKQENQVLLKKLHDVVGRYRQLQQQYQSMVSERQDQQQSASDAAVEGKGGDASPTSSGEDAATKKLEAEKHELIEKLKQVVGTCRIMQKQLQEAKEENEALKSPAKPPFSPSRGSDSSEATEALQVKIIGLERDLAQKEEEKEEIAGKLKEVIARYQSLQRQLEEKIGEHDAALSKVAALELELRTQQQQGAATSSSPGVSWMRRGSGKNSTASIEQSDQAKDKEMVKLRDDLQKLSVAMAQEEARTAVFREENVRLKEQITSILQEQQQQVQHVEADRSAAVKQVSDLQREIKLMRKQQEDAEQLYLEVASKLNHTLRENGELQSRLANLQRSLEEGDQVHEQAQRDHAVEMEKLKEQLDQAKISSESVAGHDDLIANLRQTVEALTIRDQTLSRFESELTNLGVRSDDLSITNFIAAKESEQQEERVQFTKRVEELMSELSTSQHNSSIQCEQLKAALGQIDELSQALSHLNSTQQELALLRSSASAHEEAVKNVEETLRTAQGQVALKEQELESLRKDLNASNKILEQEAAELNEEIEKLKVQLESATNSEAGIEKLLRELQQELSVARQALADKEKELHEVNVAVGKLHDSHSIERDGLETKLSQLQTDYGHTIENKDAFIEEMTRALNAKNAAIQELQAQLDGSTSENKERITFLTSTLEQLRLNSESLMTEKADLVLAIEQHQLELAAMGDQHRSLLAESSARVSELEQEVEKRERELTALRTEIDKLKAEMATLRDEHAVLIDSAGDSTKELAASHEVAIASRRKEYEAAVATFESRLSEKDEQMGKLRVEVASLQTQVMTMEAQQLQDDADAAEVANELRERIVVLERESESLRKEVAGLREEKDNLQAQVSQMTEELETTQMQKEEFDHMYREQEEEIEYLRAEVDELHHQSDRYASEITELRRQLFALPFPHGHFEGESLGTSEGDEIHQEDTSLVIDRICESLIRLGDVETELKDITSSTEVLREKLYTAAGQREAVESQLVSREAELEALIAKMETLMFEKETMRSELESTQQTMRLHANTIAELNGEIESLHQVHQADMSSSLGQADEKLVEVNARLQELESELASIKAENTRMVFEVAKTTDSAVKIKQDYEDSQAQLKNKSELCDRHENRIRELEGDASQLRNELRIGIDTLDQMRAELENANKAIESVNQESARVLEEKRHLVESLHSQLSDAIERNNLVVSEAESAKAISASLTLELDGWRRKCESAEELIQQLTDQVRLIEADKQTLVDELESVQAVTTQQLNIAEAKADEKTAEINELNESILQHRQRNLSLEETVRVLESHVDEHKSALDDHSAQLEAAREELTKQVERLSSENGVLLEEKSMLEEKVLVLENSVCEHVDLSARLGLKDQEIAIAVSSANEAMERVRVLAEASEKMNEELVALRNEAGEAAAQVTKKDDIIGKLKSKTEEVVGMYKKLKEHAQDLQEKLGEKSSALEVVQSECDILKGTNERLMYESAIATESRVVLEGELRDAKLQLTQLQEQLATTSATLGDDLAVAKAKVEELSSRMGTQIAQREEELNATITKLEEEKSDLVKTVGIKDAENQEVVDKMKELLTRHKELEEKYQLADHHISQITSALEQARGEVAAVSAQHEDSGAAHKDALNSLQSEVESLRTQLEVEVEATNATRTALEVYKKRAATALKKATLESKSSMKKVEEETNQLQEDAVAANARAAALELELEQALKRLEEMKGVSEAQIRAFKEKADTERAIEESTWRKEIEDVRIELNNVRVELTAKAHLDVRIAELNATKDSLEASVEALKKEVQQKDEVAREMMQVKDGEIAQLTEQLEEATRSASETAQTLKKVTEELNGARATAAAEPRSSEISRPSEPQNEDNHLAAAIADLKTSIPLATSSSNGAAVDSQILQLARAQAMRNEEATKSKKQLHTLEEQLRFYQTKYEDALALLEESNRQKRRIQEVSACATDGLNVEYLRNVVIKYIESQNQSEKDRLIPVIATVLHFSPQEVKRINDMQLRAQEESAGLLGGVFSLFGAAPTAPAPKPLAIPLNLNLKQPSPNSTPAGNEQEDDDEMTPLNPFASNSY